MGDLCANGLDCQLTYCYLPLGMFCSYAQFERRETFPIPDFHWSYANFSALISNKNFKRMSAK
jgi:hypothetical protein